MDYKDTKASLAAKRKFTREKFKVELRNKENNQKQLTLIDEGEDEKR